MPLRLRENICRVRQMPRNDDILMGRAELLAVEDRDLIEAILIRGQSTGSVARMIGLTPRIVRSRVYRLGRRLTSQQFLDTARALRYLSAPDALLARLRFCQGATQRQLSHRLGLSCHVLRRRLDHISAQVATIRRLSMAKPDKSGEFCLEQGTSR